MTSTEFAAKYRLLKNVATRGARSFLAQQVELGRMVMVHYLDSETPQQRAATLARLGTLRRPARDKLIEIADVDGSPVAVTLFISSFVDFATWLDSVSDPLPAAVAPPPPPPVFVELDAPPTPTAAPAEAGDFTRAFNKIDISPPKAAAAPPPTPTPKIAPQPPARSASEFTQIFGKVDEPAVVPGDTGATNPDEDEVNSPTLIMEPVKPRRAVESAAVTPPPPPPPPPPPAVPPAPSSDGGFTAIFGKLADAPPPPTPSVTPPTVEPSFSFAPASPPQPAHQDYTQPSPSSPAPGEFTQLFQRISPSGGAPGAFPFPSMAAAPPSPPRTPDRSQPIEMTSGADFAPPPLANPFFTPAAPPPPPLGAGAAPPPSLSSLGAVPSFGGAAPPLPPPTPQFSDAPVPNGSASPSPIAAPPPMWGAASAPPSLDAPFDGGLQSEFTRILGRVPVPPPQPTIAPLPTAPAAAPSAEQRPKKSLVPLWIGLNVMVLLTIAIVAYFMLRK